MSKPPSKKMSIKTHKKNITTEEGQTIQYLYINPPVRTPPAIRASVVGKVYIGTPQACKRLALGAVEVAHRRSWC